MSEKYEPKSELAKMLQAMMWECASISPMAFAQIHVESAFRACDAIAQSATREPIEVLLTENQRRLNKHQWGGASHDDTHTEADWLNFLDKQLRKAVEAQNYMREHDRFGGIGDYKQRLINIAALAQDAFASIDRIEQSKASTK